MSVLEKETYWIDLFAGAGGTSTGIHLSETKSKVIACVNHDPVALASHEANHPETKHFVEDIRDFGVVQKLKKLVDEIRAKNPKAIICIWASLECTNYSKAKGGLPRDADSRTLAEHLFMYLEELNPDFLYIENVAEFMSWGELDENGRPVKMKKGCDYIKWVENVKSYGYKYDYKLLNSADFGAYTSRIRYFGVFAKPQYKINFPEPTHYDPRKFKSQNTLFDFDKEEWKPVKEVLDLEDKGKSIFERKKPLSEKTLARIYQGLIKFVAGGDTQFLTSYYGNGSAHNVNLPCPTLTTKDRIAVNYLLYDYSQFTASSLNTPAGTITTRPKHNLVSTEWITDTQYGRVGQELDRPSFTLIARMDKKPPYIVQCKEGRIGIEIYKEDSPETIKIKQFMALYGITEVKMRMLTIPELKRIQGFGDDYILEGNSTQQKKQIGNSVVPLIATKLIEAMFN